MRNPARPAAMLIIFGGRPGVGKSTVARELAGQIHATYLRIDSIEQALRDSGLVAEPMNDAGYRVAYALAEENLSLGQTVVADSVNPLKITRDSWLEVARHANTPALEVEIVCSNATEHRRRIETRTADIPGLRLPTWDEVLARQYDSWDRPHMIIDTAVDTVERAIQKIRAEGKIRDF